MAGCPRAEQTGDDGKVERERHGIVGTASGANEARQSRRTCTAEV